MNFIFSFPGGLVDENENFLEAAKRELLEETGYTTDIKHFKLIISSNYNP